MTAVIRNIMLPVNFDFSEKSLISAAAGELSINKNLISSAKLVRKSVDARHKNNIKFCVSIAVTGENLPNNKNLSPYSENEYEFFTGMLSAPLRPVVVGFGPCGIFAALTLSKAGLKPIVLERGRAVEERKSDVEKFFRDGVLNPESNIQFGEGGAGTFSDGKLNTGTKDIRNRAVLREFFNNGADESILYDAKPHVGTDVLPKIVSGIRHEIEQLGGEVIFGAKFLSFTRDDNGISSVSYEKDGEKHSLETNDLILAVGHSARDTFRYLSSSGVELTAKPFSLGVRIEHKQADVNSEIYGKFAKSGMLGAADYKLFTHLPSGRGVYTFCMCPGGDVVNASSEIGGLVTNGMSNSKRDGENANSALLVSVNPSDASGDDPLRLMYLQERIEKNAYAFGDGKPPVQLVGDFLESRASTCAKKIKPTIKPEVKYGDLGTIFPEFVTSSLKEAIPLLARKLHFFSDNDAVLTAPETRSSSPVRIMRDDTFSATFNGLYPAGEGAGYAGGIMSSAVDGIRVAEAVIKKYKV